MKKLFFITFIFFQTILYSQEANTYMIVVIEKQSSNRLHPKETDYWIIDVESWKNSNKKAIFPLYISGFSATDYKECCVDKNLILFNSTVNESFEYEKDLLKSIVELKKIIIDKREKVQTIHKKWVTGKKEKIIVFLTPINGNFCFCELSHPGGNEKIGYNGQTAIPLSGFTINSDFWKTKISQAIKDYDFSNLPFMSLHTMQ